MAARPLTPKQRRFVEEYLVDLNATAAYRRAGYAARTDAVAASSASDLLRNPKVAAAVAEGQAARAERTEVTQDYVLANLVEVLERCMQRAPVMVREGREMVQAVDEEGRHVWAFNGKVAVSALTLLGKHVGMFRDRHEHTGKDGGPIEHAGEVQHEHTVAADPDRIAAILGVLADVGALAPGAAGGGADPQAE